MHLTLSLMLLAASPATCDTAPHDKAAMAVTLAEVQLKEARKRLQETKKALKACWGEVPQSTKAQSTKGAK